MRRLIAHGVSLMVLAAAFAVPVQAAEDPPADLKVVTPAPGFLPRSLAGEDFADHCIKLLTAQKGDLTKVPHPVQTARAFLPDEKDVANSHFVPGDEPWKFCNG